LQEERRSECHCQKAGKQGTTDLKGDTLFLELKYSRAAFQSIKFPTLPLMWCRRPYSLLIALVDFQTLVKFFTCETHFFTSDASSSPVNHNFCLRYLFSIAMSNMQRYEREIAESRFCVISLAQQKQTVPSGSHSSLDYSTPLEEIKGGRGGGSAPSLTVI